MNKLLSIIFLLITLQSCKKEDKKIIPQVETGPYSENTFTRNGLTLNWQSNTYFSLENKKRLVETFFSVYAPIFNYFNPSVRKDVTFKIDGTYTGVAYANFQTGLVIFGAAYMTANAEDIDVVTHELTHIAQAYPSYNPAWLVEGIADFSRYKFGINNTAANWTLPAVTASQNYDNSYRITGRFLVWIDTKVKLGAPKELDLALRNATYSEATWKAITGKTVQELWTMYALNPNL
ncbi:MAG: basic secretory protein-like protein [Bacteroidota bacterium]